MRGVIALLILAACNPRPTELQRLELPGFSIEAPGYVKVPPDLRYNDDEVDGQSGLQRVTILWHAGKPVANTERIEEIGAAIGAAMEGDEIEWDPVRTLTLGGQRANRLDGGAEGLSMATIVEIGCGDRSIILTFAGLGIRGFRDRMLDTFACKPIPAEEARLATATPIGSDDPTAFAGFRHVDDVLANFSITNDELIATFELEHQPTDDLAHLQDALNGMYGLDSTFTPEGKPEIRDGRTFYRGALAVDRETTRWAVAVVLRCDPKTAVFGVAMVTKPDARQKAADWLAKLRCSKPTDPPLPLAPPKPDEPDEPDAPEPEPAKPVKRGKS
jgi:hypothetical protein